MNPKKKIDIVIIGAGISGLTCARELSKHSNEINLTILEATDRIGGRIKSVISKDGLALELGAEHIHGPKGNPVFNFAYEKGIVRDVSSRQGIYFTCYVNLFWTSIPFMEHYSVKTQLFI